MKNKQLKTTYSSLLALIFGAILTLSFSPIAIAICAFISVCGFFYLLENSTKLKKKLLIGYLYGVGFFATSISWVYVSIYAFSQSLLLAIFLSLLFIIVLSIFFLIFSLLAHICTVTLSPHRVLLYPVIWVILELGRTFLFTGFPWVLLGYSQTHNFLSAYASIGSVYLVSFAVCFIAILFNELVATFWHKRIKKACFFSFGILITLLLAFLLSHITWTVPAGSKKSVNLIQGNYVQEEKWDPQMLQKIINYYYQATDKNSADLIFWPENAIPTFKPYIEPFLQQINELGKAHNNAILVGTVALNKQDQYFNSAFVYGNGSGHYYKHHLVPFGEYYPFAKWLEPLMQHFSIPMSSFTKGQEIQPLLDMNGISVALYICYESAYPTELRAQLQNADLIGIISDDAWFGDSLAPWQHLEIAQMRAIETGRYVIQATNNGVTAIINPKGEITKHLPQNTQAILSGYITPMKGNTIWLLYGLYPLFALMLMFIAISVLTRFFNRR
ncbi:apolipoprotein N-acyltransferase [Fangia hongkongensis]|uniref:apolipoprotein N-acyltransferase n=1 Tax=Fangia hongkongensis TaxID=270495 RepID=UPI0003695C88|nr:apolipoprotein N-acyltransferase [Fangia hongkongensis]MBK2124230.1 apolipoprotein N-acyltransferase [Fangia hongkongensis]